jgi:hypothetical protein
MEKTRFLTEEEKQRGVKGLVQFQSFNGMGYSFLGDTTVYLLAIMYGASNVQLGYISSAAFLSGIFLPLVPRLFAGRNIVAVLSTAWILRGLVCIGYTGLYFLEGRAAVYLILAIYTSFSVIRTAGVVMFRPMMRMISTNANQGQVVGKSDFAFQSSAIFSRGASFLITSFERFSGLNGLMGLQLIGVLSNTLAGLSVRKIPCRETVEYRKGAGVLSQLRTAGKNKNLLRALILQWLSIAVLVLANLTIPFVRSRLSFTTSEVFLFSMGITLATILAAMFVRTFADKIGSRPLIIITSLFTLIFTAVWAFLPETLGKVIYFIPGILLMFMVSTSRMLIGKLMIQVMPDDDRIGFNSMVDFITALISLILGVAGGRLIDYGPDGGTLLLNGYTWTFALGALLSFLIFLLTLHLEESDTMEEKDAAALLLSIDGLRAFMHISKLQRISDPIRKQTVLLSIGSNRNDVATSEIRRMLLSPFSSEKAELIRSLFYNPRPSLLPLLLEEAADYDSYTQNEAIFALGAYKSAETEKLLLKLLESSSARVRASAAKALGGIGHTASLGRISAMFLGEQDVRNRMNYTIALSNMDPDGEYLQDLFSSRMQEGSRRFRQSLFSLNAELLNYTPDLAHLFQLGNARKGAGLRDFLDETRDHPNFMSRHPELVGWFRTEQYGKIVDFCRTIMVDSGIRFTEPMTVEARRRSTIRKSITACCERFNTDAKTNYDFILALLYYTYQVVKPD